MRTPENKRKKRFITLRPTGSADRPELSLPTLFTLPSSGYSLELTDMEGIGSWPITMGTYVAVPKVANDTERTARVLRFFAWAYAAGDTLARDAKFVPLPDKVQANAFKVLSSIVGAGGERIGVDSLRGVSNSWR